MPKSCPNCGFEFKKQIYLEGFKDFWDSYPRRVGKGAAERAWSKLKPHQILISDIMLAIDRQKKSESWTKEGGIYIPHPSTWINQRRWEDDWNGKKEEPKFDPQRLEQRTKELEAKKERIYHQRIRA